MSGDVFTVRRRFTQQDFHRYAALSGDDNPIHVDPAFAATSKFGRPVAHGMLLYGAVCGALGHQLPGSRPLLQTLMFPAPTFADEEVTVELQGLGRRPGSGMATLSTRVLRPGGEIGLQGEATVLLSGEVPEEILAPAPEQADGGSFRGLQLGQSAVTQRAFTTADLAEYANLARDPNPLYLDAAFARRLGLPGPAVPGSLLGGLFSYLLGTRLPGRGTNYLKQRLAFPRLAHLGRSLTASVTIIRLRPEKNLVNLRTDCTDEAGAVVCHGEALVLVSDLAR